MPPCQPRYLRGTQRSWCGHSTQHRRALWPHTITIWNRAELLEGYDATGSHHSMYLSLKLVHSVEVADRFDVLYKGFGGTNLILRFDIGSPFEKKLSHCHMAWNWCNNQRRSSILREQKRILQDTNSMKQETTTATNSFTYRYVNYY